jgi:hypothetical protein
MKKYTKNGARDRCHRVDINFIFCVLFLAFFSTSSAFAAIVNLGKITRDTDTGLEWLDVTETLSQSVNTVKNRMSGQGDLVGWRHATYKEFEVLLVNFGYQPRNSNCPNGQMFCDYGMRDDIQLIRTIIATLGDTDIAAYGPTFRQTETYLAGGVAGYFDSDIINPESPDFAQISAINTKHTDSGLPATDRDYFVDSLRSSSHARFSTSATNAGHFLVRSSSTPLPDTPDAYLFADESRLMGQNNQVVQTQLGTATGQGIGPGNNIAEANDAFENAAFVPRILGAPQRLEGVDLMKRMFPIIHQELKEQSATSSRMQNNQGVLNFDMTEYSVSALPIGRIVVTTQRNDGLTANQWGHLEFTTGNLMTTVVPSVQDPARFAQDLVTQSPGANVKRLEDGIWLVSNPNGSGLVIRPDWARIRYNPSEMFFHNPNGVMYYHQHGYIQAIWPEFLSYAKVQEVLRLQMSDPNLQVFNTFSGKAVVRSGDVDFTITPEMELIRPAAVAGKPAYWTEGEMLYIKYDDGSAQGFTSQQ